MNHPRPSLSGIDVPLQVPFQTGVIDIGSHSVRLDIYELNRLWQPEKLESLSRAFNLGADVFRNGFVSVENVAKLVELVNGYRDKLREYGTDHCRIIATSAVRESFNKELICDRFLEAGMVLEILEGTTEGTLTYQAVREVLSVNCQQALSNAVMLIMGSGSLFVIGVVGGLMRFCEMMPTGTLRLSDAAENPEHPLEQLRENLKSQRILRRLDESMRRRSDVPVSLVIVGNPARKLAAFADKAPLSETQCAGFQPQEFAEILDECENSGGKKLRKLNPDDAAELSSAAVIVRHFFESIPCREIICPGMTTRGALLRDLVRRCRTPGVDPFRADLAAVCGAIGRKYDFDVQHAANVAAMSQLIYNKLRSSFSFPENSSLLLEAAAQLHDIGRFVDSRHHHRHSWYLVSHSQLPGLTDSEHRVVAAVVRYHGRTLPRENHPEYAVLSSEEKVSVLKLAAIIKVADALDMHNEQAAGKLKLSLRGRCLYIISGKNTVFSGCKYALKNKSGLFENVFGLEVRLEDGE